MLVCLKMLVIFLICGDEHVKVAHLVPLLEGVVVGVGDLGKELFSCILSLNRVSRARGIPLLCAIYNMCCYSLSAYALHILNNQHKYGPIGKTMTLLKPLKHPLC